MKFFVSVSGAPIAKLGDKEYCDLIGTIDVMKRFFSESVVDGFELQLVLECDSSNPPLTDRDFAEAYIHNTFVSPQRDPVIQVQTLRRQHSRREHAASS